MIDARQPRRAAIYCRISNDREGRQLGVERQEQDCRRRAEQLGWEVVEVFTDNDRSASRNSKKPRPRFEEMIRRVEADDLNAILSWSTSRLTRRPLEHETVMIPLFEAKKVPISTVKAGDHDYTTARGRSRARDDARRDAEEAEEISERVSREAQQRAEHGKWHGGRVPPPGLDVVRNERGKVVGMVLNQEQSTLLREAAERLLVGDSLYTICTEWQEAGIRTRLGARWVPSTLRRSLLAPSSIAKRTHKSAPGKLFDTTWPEVLDRQTWDRLHDLFGDPTRKFPPTDGSYAGKRALGGGVTICDVCDKKLLSQRHRGKVRLICHGQATGGCGMVTVNYESLETFVTDMLLARLDSPQFRRALARKETDTTGRERALRDELRRLDGQRTRAQRAYLADIMTEAESRAEVREVEARQEKVRAELTDLVAALAVVSVRNADEARELLRDADVQRRRRFYQSFIAEVRVRPWPKGRCSTLTRRKTETAAEFAERRFLHDRETARLRIDIKWQR